MSDNVSVSVKIEKKKNRDSKKKETNHTITFRKKNYYEKKFYFVKGLIDDNIMRNISCNIFQKQ